MKVKVFWLFCFFSTKIRSSLFDLTDMPQIHLGNFGFGIEEWEEMMTKSTLPFWVRKNRVYRT